MLLFKGKAIAANKNYKEKSQWFQTFTFHFAWRAKCLAGFQQVDRLRTDNTISHILRFSNYRPILVLLILSKSFERHIYDSVCSYLSRYNLLCGLQSGF